MITLGAALIEAYWDRKLMEDLYIGTLVVDAVGIITTGMLIGALI